jgi:hypothetical protein
MRGEKKAAVRFDLSKCDSGVAVKTARRWTGRVERCVLDDLEPDNTNPVPAAREHRKRCSGAVFVEPAPAASRSCCATMAHATPRVARLGAAFSRPRELS